MPGRLNHPRPIIPKVLIRFGWMLVLLLLSLCTKDTIIPPVPIPVPKGPCAPKVVSGFTDRTSYFPGDSIAVFLQANQADSLCLLDVYDVNGAVAYSIPSTLFIQTSADTTWAGYDFKPTVKFVVPSTLPSGIYRVENKIPFIIKTREPVDLMIIYPVNTTNAYDVRGGKSLYSQEDRPSSVSFRRPIGLQANALFCLKWFTELTHVSIGYISDVDMEFYSSIEQAKVLVIPGHSEYWTRNARLHFDRFVNSGKHALLLSGNTMWWQVRYSPDFTQMICYKDANLDPEVDPLLKTINWNVPSLNYSILESIGADFQHGGFGLDNDAGWNGFRIFLPKSPLLKGTSLNKSDTLLLPSGEYDGAPVLGFDLEGFPHINGREIQFQKLEMIGFDRGSRGGKETIGTFIAFQRTPTSGMVVNMASYDWCSYRGVGSQRGDVFKQITSNAIELLVSNQSVFSK